MGVYPEMYFKLAKQSVDGLAACRFDAKRHTYVVFNELEVGAIILFPARWSFALLSTSFRGIRAPARASDYRILTSLLA